MAAQLLQEPDERARRAAALSEQMVHKPAQAPVRSDGLAPRQPIRSVEPETPQFVFPDWEYIRLGQPTLLDAAGGTGKTSLILGVSAMASNGISPGGAKIEPFTTLYYGDEDSAGEMRTAYDRLGGHPDRLYCIPDMLRFDARGIKTLHADLEQTGAKLFVLDAAKYYLPNNKPNAEFDADVVQGFMHRMRHAARTYSCGALLVRHFARNTSVRDLLDQGAGIAQWHSSCRSQIVAVKAETRGPGNALVFHAKPSLLTRRQKPFGCGYNRSGDWGFWKPKPEDLAPFGYDEEGEKVMKTGRPPESIDAAKQFICDTLREGGMRSGDIIDLAAKEGIKRSTLYEAKKAMGSQIDDRRGYWKFDPYSD